MTAEPIIARGRRLRKPEVKLWEVRKDSRTLNRYYVGRDPETETIHYEVYVASPGHGEYVLMHHDLFEDICHEINRLRALEADRR